ncbi:MAG: hypothetical protein U0232_22640 [Thermomicrobiales bacterium]
MVRALRLPARGAGVAWRLAAALALVATLLVGAFAQPGGVAAATALTVNGDWTAFTFGGVGSAASGQPFTFTTVANTEVIVNDCDLNAERFNVYDNNVLLGETYPPGDATPMTIAYPGCVYDYRESYRVYPLAPGSHSITISPSVSPGQGGTGYVRVLSTQLPTETTRVRGDAAYGDTTALLTATVTQFDQQGPAFVSAAFGPQIAAFGPPVPAGGQVRFSLFGQVVGIGLTNALGVATINAPLPPGLAPGTYFNQVKAEYLENAEYYGSTGLGPLVIGRRVLWVKPVDRTVVLKQPNPPTNPHQDASCAAPNWCIELANGSAFAPGETFANLDLSLLRFQYARNPPSTNSIEKVGSTYRVTAFGVNVKNYDIRYLPGTMKVVAATP